MTTVVNIYHKPCEIYVGRAGKGEKGTFGNPFTLREHGKDALLLFKFYFRGRLMLDPEFTMAVAELRGKKLGCFCRPRKGFQGQLLCHAQIIAGWLDGVPPETIG